jgi:hypothetical protein
MLTRRVVSGRVLLDAMESVRMYSWRATSHIGAVAKAPTLVLMYGSRAMRWRAAV